MSPAITRRRVTELDAPFLFALFKDVRSADFAHAALPPAQLDLLMQMQFKAQTVGYGAQYPNADHEIILRDGNPIGRIWVDRGGTEFQLVDISLALAERNHGIGTALLTELIAEARQAGVPLRCSVGTGNPGSLRFHQRLGFRIVAQDAVYYELEHVALEHGNAGLRSIPAARLQ